MAGEGWRTKRPDAPGYWVGRNKDDSGRLHLFDVGGLTPVAAFNICDLWLGPLPEAVAAGVGQAAPTATGDQCTNCGLCCVTFDNGVCGRCGEPIDTATLRGPVTVADDTYWPASAPVAPTGDGG